jgi:predicted ATPase
MVLSSLDVSGSLLSILKTEAVGRTPENIRVLEGLQAWFNGITSLELLSPVAMRRGARGKQTDIGPRGEYLSGFLASLSPERRAKIVKRVQAFYPLQSLDTVRKRAGWIDVQIAEQYQDLGRIATTHMSDGFFRLLAMCSIPEFNENSSIVLLDEVEDGIEPHVLPLLIKQIETEISGQLIMTSHSPLLINTFDPDGIVMVARDKFGRTKTSSVKDMKTFELGLEYLGSGEIWANSDRDTIYREVYDAEQGDRNDGVGSSGIERAREFFADL